MIGMKARLSGLKGVSDRTLGLKMVERSLNSSLLKIQDTPFTQTLKNPLVKGPLASLRVFVLAILCKSEMTVGNVAIVMGSLNSMCDKRGRGQGEH